MKSLARNVVVGAIQWYAIRPNLEGRSRTGPGDAPYCFALTYVQRCYRMGTYLWFKIPG